MPEGRHPAEAIPEAHIKDFITQIEGSHHMRRGAFRHDERGEIPIPPSLRSRETWDAIRPLVIADMPRMPEETHLAELETDTEALKSNRKGLNAEEDSVLAGALDELIAEKERTIGELRQAVDAKRPDWQKEQRTKTTETMVERVKEIGEKTLREMGETFALLEYLPADARGKAVDLLVRKKCDGASLEQWCIKQYGAGEQLPEPIAKMVTGEIQRMKAEKIHASMSKAGHLKGEDAQKVYAQLEAALGEWKPIEKELALRSFRFDEEARREGATLLVAKGFDDGTIAPAEVRLALAVPTVKIQREHYQNRDITAEEQDLMFDYLNGGGARYEALKKKESRTKKQEGEFQSLQLLMDGLQEKKLMEHFPIQQAEGAARKAKRQGELAFRVREAVNARHTIEGDRVREGKKEYITKARELLPDDVKHRKYVLDNFRKTVEAYTAVQGELKAYCEAIGVKEGDDAVLRQAMKDQKIHASELNRLYQEARRTFDAVSSERGRLEQQKFPSHVRSVHSSGGYFENTELRTTYQEALRQKMLTVAREKQSAIQAVQRDAGQDELFRETTKEGLQEAERWIRGFASGSVPAWQYTDQAGDLAKEALAQEDPDFQRQCEEAFAGTTTGYRSLLDATKNFQKGEFFSDPVSQFQKRVIDTAIAMRKEIRAEHDTLVNGPLASLQQEAQALRNDRDALREKTFVIGRASKIEELDAALRGKAKEQEAQSRRAADMRDMMQRLDNLRWEIERPYGS